MVCGTVTWDRGGPDQREILTLTIPHWFPKYHFQEIEEWKLYITSNRSI